jgi:hypothetical protein
MNSIAAAMFRTLLSSGTQTVLFEFPYLIQVSYGE